MTGSVLSYVISALNSDNPRENITSKSHDNIFQVNANEYRTYQTQLKSETHK
jgi:hypothetical protein